MAVKTPTTTILRREDALALGLKRYFTGKPCRNGHIAERSVRGMCLECRSEWSAKHRDMQQAARQAANYGHSTQRASRPAARGQDQQAASRPAARGYRQITACRRPAARGAACQRGRHNQRMTRESSARRW
jgi:hypothetical protein